MTLFFVTKPLNKIIISHKLTNKINNLFNFYYICFSSADYSVTSSVIRDEADQLLRGDLNPSDSMCAFLDGAADIKPELVTIQWRTEKTCKVQARLLYNYKSYDQGT